MLASEAQTRSRREAALVLHALDASTRERVMSCLDESVRSDLRALLDELEALGIPYTLAHGALVRARAATVEAANTHSAMHAARCLETLAPATAAAVLRTAPGRWRVACRQAMSPEHFAEIDAEFSSPSVLSPHAARRLMVRFAEHLRRQPTTVESVDPPRAMRSWFGALRDGLRWNR